MVASLPDGLQTRNGCQILSAVVGSVPLMNNSLVRSLQYGVGSSPDVPQMSMVTMPGGIWKPCTGTFFSANSIKSCQMGPAPVTPVECSIEVLLLLPTQTPVTNCGV